MDEELAATDEALPEISQTEYDFFVVIREALDHDETLEEIRAACEMAFALMERSEKSRLN